VPKLQRSTAFDRFFADKRVSYASEAFQYPTHLGRCSERAATPFYFLQKRGFASFLRRLRSASRTPAAHGRFAQRVFSDAHVVRKNDLVHFAPAGAKKAARKRRFQLLTS